MPKWLLRGLMLIRIHFIWNCTKWWYNALDLAAIIL
jgi:hypothetical protein